MIGGFEYWAREGLAVETATGRTRRACRPAHRGVHVTARGRLLFASMSIIWGVPYLFIKVAVEDFSPAAVVFGRTALAALLLVPIAAARGMLLPVAAALGDGCWRSRRSRSPGPFLLLTYAEQRISSSLTGLLVAAVPTPGSDVRQASLASPTPIDARRLLGLIVGVLGVGVLVGVDLHADSWTAAVAVLFAAAGLRHRPDRGRTSGSPGCPRSASPPSRWA
jgi:drug/metabolite transporter (DMT)-like permease